jgi:peroxiredoxin
LLYTYWYSHLERRPLSTLVHGAPLPDFPLEDESGADVSSLQFSSSPTLWLFYRGNWCPLCMAQIKEIAGQYCALQERGVQIVLVSPQSHARTRELAEQFDVDFTFLVDRDHRAARQLGIDHSYGTPMGMQMLGYDSETILPTVVIADGEGKIILADQTDNYRIRPEPETFLRAFDEHALVITPAI